MTIENKKPQVFICYAHKDNDSSELSSKHWLERLREHLGPLESQGALSIWSDQEIESGVDWRDHIQSTLKTVKAAVLLISPSFLNSEYIRNSELPILLQRAKQSGVLILPLILRHCVLDKVLFKFPDPVIGPEELSLSSLQSVNSLNKPLNSLSEAEQDKILVLVARRLLTLTEVSAPEPSKYQKHSRNNQQDKNAEREARVQRIKNRQRVRRRATSKNSARRKAVAVERPITKENYVGLSSSNPKNHEPLHHRSLSLKKALLIFLRKTAIFQAAVLATWVFASLFLSGLREGDFIPVLFVTGSLAGLTSGLIEGVSWKLLFPHTKVSNNLLQFAVLGLAAGSVGWILLGRALSNRHMNNNGNYWIGIISGLVVLCLYFWTFYRQKTYLN